MSFHAWPDNEVQDDAFVGQNVLVPRPAFEGPLVPNAAYEISAESLSHSLSAAISPQERAEQPHLMDQDVWGEPFRIVHSDALFLRPSRAPYHQGLPLRDHHATFDGAGQEDAFLSISEGSAPGQNTPQPQQPTQPPQTPGQPSPSGIGQQSRALPSTASSRELRMCELRENLERQRLIHAEAMLALEIARHQSSSHYD